MEQLQQEILNELKKLNAHAENIEQLLQPKTLELKADISGKINPEQIALMLGKLPLSH